LKTPDGLVILLGCAHAGLANILDHIIGRTGENRIHALIGGTHLGFFSDERLERTIDALRNYDIHMLAVSHCTGQRPAARLAAEFGERFAFAHVGFTLPSDS
jgi:7,8-dihydropterin-6-yl-methyl-4-(beta-D-ribofuranosyl)aminobenzene 5'-phosphate synthase